MEAQVLKAICCQCGALIREGDGTSDLVSHGFCGPCAEAALAEFEAWATRVNEGGER